MEQILDAWSIKGPWTLSPLQGGKNKQVWCAENPDGQKYVLRLTSNHQDLPRLRYETAVLEALACTELPFLLPLPLRSRNGDYIVPSETENGTTAWATVSAFLPGQNLKDWTDLNAATQAAGALAHLDRALAVLSDISISKDIQSLPTFGEFTHWHPLVSDPLTVIEQLPLSQEQVGPIRKFLIEVMEKVPHLYESLPQQLLHRDYDPTNILIDEQQHITAILDFEFVGRDLRVLDLCVALSWWPVDVLGTGQEWSIIDTFGRNYVAQFPLSEQGLFALPDIFRLRDAFSLFFRIGRYLAGMETDASIQNRVQHSLWREAWLSTNWEKLQQCALSWKGS